MCVCAATGGSQVLPVKEVCELFMLCAWVCSHWMIPRRAFNEMDDLCMCVCVRAGPEGSQGVPQIVKCVCVCCLQFHCVHVHVYVLLAIPT